MKAKQKWMTNEILDLMKVRKAAKNTPEYNTIDKEIQRKCSKEKEQWLNKKCEEIEQSSQTNGTKKMHEDIKIITGNTKSKNSSGCIKDKKGKIIFEKDKVLERWSEYIGDLVSHTRPTLPSSSNNEGQPILQE